jgi:hypothetical protein
MTSCYGSVYVWLHRPYDFPGVDVCGSMLQAAEVFQTKEEKSAIVVLSPLGVDSPAGRPRPNQCPWVSENRVRLAHFLLLVTYCYFTRFYAINPTSCTITLGIRSISFSTFWREGRHSKRKGPSTWKTSPRSLLNDSPCSTYSRLQ